MTPQAITLAIGLLLLMACDRFFTIEATVIDCGTHVPVSGVKATLKLDRGVGEPDLTAQTGLDGRLHMVMNEPPSSWATLKLEKVSFRIVDEAVPGIAGREATTDLPAEGVEQWSSSRREPIESLTEPDSETMIRSAPVDEDLDSKTARALAATPPGPAPKPRTEKGSFPLGVATHFTTLAPRPERLVEHAPVVEVQRVLEPHVLHACTDPGQPCAHEGVSTTTPVNSRSKRVSAEKL